jgi:hypothetical protein
MHIKTKKHNADGIVRLETSGEIKEILMNEDFMNPKNASVALCFRGKSSSGIVELTPEEIEQIYKTVFPKMNLLKGTKVLKFEK